VPDELWNQVRPLIPNHGPQRGRRPKAHPRRVVAALVWVKILGRSVQTVRDGAGLNDRTARDHFATWESDGTWRRIRPVLEQYVSLS
jgi:transposase